MMLTAIWPKFEDFIKIKMELKKINDQDWS